MLKIKISKNKEILKEDEQNCTNLSDYKTYRESLKTLGQNTNRFLTELIEKQEELSEEIYSEEDTSSKSSSEGEEECFKRNLSSSSINKEMKRTKTADTDK